MKQMPRRKNVRIKKYDYSQNGYYYITICTKNKQEILSEITTVGVAAHSDKCYKEMLKRGEKMKLQGLTVIFIIIALPIILVLSYYISLQIDTINMQAVYNRKLLDSTKEAIEAFEINTVEWNEAFSTVADSKRRDIMASINTFTTSFANNIGIAGSSKEQLLTYIPAIAYTLYDGYYIYSPTETATVIKDKNGTAVYLDQDNGDLIDEYEYKLQDKGKILYKCAKEKESDGKYDGEPFTFEIKNAQTEYKHILKPFTAYSANYIND
ncbi:MAG: hypothetical protein Q4G09_01190, partial [Clostridia bacterium]|nr:hypothetical protein [Clostridia bacterium]